MVHGHAPVIPLNDTIYDLGADQNRESGQHALTSGHMLEGNEHILTQPLLADERSDDHH